MHRTLSSIYSECAERPGFSIYWSNKKLKSEPTKISRLCIHVVLKPKIHLNLPSVYSSKAKKSFLLIFMPVLLLFKLSPMVLRVHMRSPQPLLNTLHISKYFQIQNYSTNVISWYCIFTTAYLSSQLIVLNCSESKGQKSLVGTGHNNIKLFGL